MSDRKAWAAEILDFLSWRGKVLFDAQWSPSTVPELTQAIGDQSWEQLVVLNLVSSPNFVEGLRELHRLAPREAEQDRHKLISVTRGRIHGRILARRTLVTRTRMGDPTIWVTHNTSKEWQTEANQAVVSFLTYLSNVSKHGMKGAPAVQESVSTNGINSIEALLRAEPLRHVNPGHYWASILIPPQLRAKSRFYRLMSEWMDLVRGALASRDSVDIRNTLMQGWLRAEDDERLLELFALSVAIRTLREIKNWSNFSLDFGRRGSLGSMTVTARDTDATTRISFDRSPETGGNYAWILARYSGIDGRGRRPDLTIETTTHQARRTTFIEVKATEPNSQYGRDSIVKVLGYLKDFENTWDHENEIDYPRCVLLYAKGISSHYDRSVRFREDELALSDTDSFRDDLKELLARHIST